MKCEFLGRCGGCRDVSDGPAPAFDAPFARPMARVPEGTRRRIRLKLDYGGNLGFYAARSNDVAAIDSCPAALPSISGLIGPLAGLAASFSIKSEGEIGVTAVDNGITLEFYGMKIHPLDAQKIRNFARERKILRATAGKEAIFESARPFVEIGGRRVPYPPGSFLQPSKEGEEAIVSAARSMIPPGAKTGCDLFCGLGLFTLSFPEIEWRAFDCDAAAVKILRGFGIKAQERDLFASPVRRFDCDAAILDPPRAGAAAQCRAIADAGPERVVYVSCNPAAFARDRAALEAGGYRLFDLAPIDQFPNSGHMELVAGFARDQRQTRREMEPSSSTSAA